MRPDTHTGQVEEVRRLVALKGGRCWVTSQGHRLRGSAGIPDLYVVAPHGVTHEVRAVWMEVKVGKDRLRPAQEEFIRTVQKAGRLVVVGRCKDLMQAMGW